MKEVFVNMGQIEILRGQGILTTVGLGSCIGLALYDSSTKVGALAHVFLSESRADKKAKLLPGKYADTAVPAIVDACLKQGARRSRLVAKIAGGAHLFSSAGSGTSSVGDKNIKAVREHLKLARIPIKGEDVAGTYGRKLRFHIDTGVVVVTAIGKESIEI